MTASITMSDRAAKRIREILADDPSHRHLRVSVSGGGCSGFQYGFVLDNERSADDVMIERDGATVLIDAVSLAYMQGSEIDYVDDLIGAAFKIKNPLATASCGCGTSFSI
jgi:iron-sulfur cluster insertion protein